MPFFPVLFKLLAGAAVFQGPARLLCVYTLSVAALAGLGTDQLLRFDRLRWSGRILLVAALGVLAAVIAGVTLTGVRAVLVRPVIQFGVTLGACAACLAFRPSLADRRFSLWQIALLGVVALDLLVADWRLNPTTDAGLYQAQASSARAVQANGEGRIVWLADGEDRLKFSRYFSFRSFGTEDVEGWLGARESLLPNVALIDRLPSASNFDSLLVGRYHDVMALLNDPSGSQTARMAGLMNARYILSARETARDLSLPIVWRNADVTIYRNDAAAGRAWIVPEARPVEDSLAALADPSFDPRRQVLLEPAGAVDRGHVGVKQTSSGASIALQDSGNTVTIRAASESGGFLVVADTFYPGWYATLDEKPAPLLRANHAFRAIALPPGEHTVVFQYAPLSFRAGAAISLLTLALVIGALVILGTRPGTRYLAETL